MKIHSSRASFQVTVPPKGTQTVIDEPVDFETAIAQTGFGKFNYLLMSAGFFSTIVCLADTTTMSYILPLAQCDLELTDLSKGALNAITYAGLITGSFVWGFLSDTLGRHRLLVATLLMDGAVGLCSAFSTSLWIMLLLRYLNGCVSCGALCINFSYLAEFHGAQYRNRCVMTTGIYVGIAQVALPAIGLALLTETWQYDTGVLTLRPWNVFVMMCAIPALTGGLLISFFPETPKFLMAHGRNHQALAIMRRIYALNTGRSPDTFPVRRLVEEVSQRKTSLSSTVSSPKSVLEGARAGWKQIRPLFRMPHLPYAMLVFSVQAGCLLSLNTVRLWLPQIFTTMEEFYQAQRLLGLEGQDAYLCEALTFRERNATLAAAVASAASDLTGAADNATAATCVPALTSPNIYTNSMIVCASATFAIFISTTLVNIIGYRLLIITMALLSAAFSVLVLWSVGSAATLALLTLYLATVNVYGACMIGVVVALFPTTLRTMAISLTMMCGFISALLGNLIYPILMAIGCETPFYVVTACNLGFGRFNYRLLLAAFLSATEMLWGTTTMAYVIPLARCDLALTSIDRGALNAITYAGLISSSLLWGPVADTVGRVKLLKYTMFIDGCLAFISAFSPSLWMLLPLRYAVGFMASPLLPLTTTILTEFHDSLHRRTCQMAFGTFLGIAQILLPVLGLAMLLDTWELDVGTMYLYPWNAFMIVCALPSLVGALNYAFLPETPKFLMSQGRQDEALAVMSKMYAANTGNDPSTFPVERLVEDLPTARRSTIFSVDVLVHRVLAGCHQVLGLFTKEYVYLTLLVLFIMGLDLLSMNTIRLWLPQLFTTLQEFYEAQKESGNTTAVTMCEVLASQQANIGVQEPDVLKSLPFNVTAITAVPRTCVPPLKTKTIYIKSMILTGCVTVAVAASSVLVGLLGYKWVIVPCFLLASIFCVSVLFSTGWITTVVLFTIYIANLNIATTCMMGEIASIFPTKLRATAVSIGMMSGYSAALIGLLFFPLLLELGCEMSFIIIACLLLGWQLY